MQKYIPIEVQHLFKTTIENKYLNNYLKHHGFIFPMTLQNHWNQKSNGHFEKSSQNCLNKSKRNCIQQDPA